MPADRRARERARHEVTCPEDVLPAAYEALRAGNLTLVYQLLARVDCKLRLQLGRRKLRRHAWPAKGHDRQRRGYWWGAACDPSDGPLISAVGNLGQVWRGTARSRPDNPNLYFLARDSVERTPEEWAAVYQEAWGELIAYLQERAVEWRWRPWRPCRSFRKAVRCRLRAGHPGLCQFGGDA